MRGRAYSEGEGRAYILRWEGRKGREWGGEGRGGMGKVKVREWGRERRGEEEGETEGKGMDKLGERGEDGRGGREGIREGRGEKEGG